MSIQNRKRRAISYDSETDSEIENELNKNMRGRKNLRKLPRRILNSSESEDSDIHDKIKTICKKMI
jgi:hypothetical protein